MRIKKYIYDFSFAIIFFQCDTFEVLREREGLSVVVNLRFGAYYGHVIEFEVEVNSLGAVAPHDGTMALTYSGLMVLHCQQVNMRV